MISVTNNNNSNSPATLLRPKYACKRCRRVKKACDLNWPTCSTCSKAKRHVICEYDKDILYLNEATAAAAILHSPPLQIKVVAGPSYPLFAHTADHLPQLDAPVSCLSTGHPISSTTTFSAKSDTLLTIPDLQDSANEKYSRGDLLVFEKHLSVLAFFTFTGYTTWKEKYGLMALHPMMLVQYQEIPAAYPNVDIMQQPIRPRKISDHLITSMYARAVFISNHEFIAKSGFASKSELADSLYPFVPIDVMSLDHSMDLFEVCDLIRSLFLRMIQLAHGQSLPVKYISLVPRLMHDLIIKYGFLDHDVFGISPPVMQPIHAVFSAMSGTSTKRKPRVIADDLRGEMLTCIAQYLYCLTQISAVRGGSYAIDHIDIPSIHYIPTIDTCFAFCGESGCMESYHPSSSASSMPSAFSPNASSMARPKDEPSIWDNTLFSKNFMSMIHRQQRPYCPDILAHSISMISLLKVYWQINDLNRRIVYNFVDIDLYQNIFFLHSSLLEIMSNGRTYFSNIQDLKRDVSDEILASSKFQESIEIICMLTRLHYNSYCMPREYNFPLYLPSHPAMHTDTSILAPSAHSNGIIIYCLTGLCSIIMHFQGDSENRIASPLFVHGEASAIEIFKITALALTVFSSVGGGSAGSGVTMNQEVYVYRCIRYALVPCIRSMAAIWPVFIQKATGLEKSISAWCERCPYLTNEIAF